MVWQKEVQAFAAGLLDAGYSEGRDVVIEWRYANGDYDSGTRVRRGLGPTQSRCDCRGVYSRQPRRAKHATSTIPIVMAIVADPVGSGLVANLAHPGGNVTGLSLMTTDLTVKRLQLLKEALPESPGSQSCGIQTRHPTPR